MIFVWLIYVSAARVPIGVDLADLVAQSRLRNSTLDITGSLIFTGKHFAQYLEGPAPALDQLMASIRAEERHEDVITVASGESAERRFAAWTLCYAGPSTFAGRTVTAALMTATGGNNSNVNRLILLMQEFAKP